jgi:CRISPR-associated endonuclease/helicase Cas3
MDLCRRFNVFERAAQAGAADVELVVIASPVIETGNDLDFDYAVIDPVSLRAVIQAAGRVNRHRMRPVTTPNVALLARSPIAMQAGRLEMPGVETRPAPDTKVSRVLLDEFPNRLAEKLIGAETVSIVTAKVLLSDEGNVPLREKEKLLRLAMLGTSTPTSPGSCYLTSPLARLSAAMPRLRRFRRSTSRDLVYAFFGENIEEAEWHIDLAPGTPNSRFDKVIKQGLTVGELKQNEFLLSDLTAGAWRDLTGLGSEMGKADMQRLLRVEVPDYGVAEATVRPVCYTEQTGMTWGAPEDLCAPFGKAF